jgi:hypothetical protein
MQRARSLGLLISLALVLLAPATAHAQTGVGFPLAAPASMTTPPPGFTTSAREALAIAKRQPAVVKAQREHPNAELDAQIWDGSRWEVDLLTRAGGDVIVDVDISAAGRVTGVWTGLAAGNYLARGDFDPIMRKPWVWLTFGILFLAPFVDPRRLRRLLHLDLAVLLSFGVSYAFFERGHPETAIWLFYPPLLYLLGRMLLTGLRPRTRAGRLVPLMPTAMLAVGVIALFGARVALNVHSDKVLDVGYASVVGADRIAHKQELYVDNDTHGDTYGPIAYIAYIPFELAFPWKGEWDAVPAAHAAALTFDLLTLVGLFLLGMRLRAGPRGRRLGLALAWAWAACPFTLLGLLQNTNDGLVAMLLVFSLLAFGSAPARGALLGLATAAKFFPGALLLLVARGRDGDGRRQRLQTVAACVGVFVFAMAVYFPAGGLRELWNCTLGFQLDRPADFSPWAIVHGAGWTQTVLKGLAVVIVAAVSFLPGRRTLTQISALAAAVLIAIQLPSGHWFYLYIPWFAPMLLTALFSAYREPEAVATAADLDAESENRSLADRPAPLTLAS